MNRAVFFDRDGVLIEDIGLLIRKEQVVLNNDVLSAFKLLKNRDYKLIVVSNQAVVARGIAKESDVEEVNDFILEMIYDKTGVKIHKFYFCPHHPNATLEYYRLNCECRKPRPGMLLKAAEKFDIDLSQSYMIGDRISDIIVGATVGCTTILLETGRHKDAPIESDAMDLDVAPDYSCETLSKAIRIILNS